MDALTPGMATSVTLDAAGKASLSFTPPKAGKYVFLPSAAPALIGVYQGMEPVGANGKLRIEAGQVRGVRILASTPHLVTFAGHAGSVVTLLARPWSFWDYFG